MIAHPRDSSARRRSQAPDQGCREAACPIRRGGCSCAAARASARSRSSPAATSSTARRPRSALMQDFLFQRSRAGLAVQSQQAGADLSRQRDDAAVPVQRLLPRGGRAGGRQGRTTSSRSAAWSTTRSPGRSTSSTRCRRRPRSPATSASRAGARSANGRGVPLSRLPAPRRRRHPRANTSGSAAPRAIPPPSTWRPRCIRRRR